MALVILCDNYVKTKQSCHLIVILTKLEIVSVLYQSQQEISWINLVRYNILDADKIGGKQCILMFCKILC